MAVTASATAKTAFIELPPASGYQWYNNNDLTVLNNRYEIGDGRWENEGLLLLLGSSGHRRERQSRSHEKRPPAGQARHRATPRKIEPAGVHQRMPERGPQPNTRIPSRPGRLARPPRPAIVDERGDTDVCRLEHVEPQ